MYVFSLRLIFLPWSLSECPTTLARHVKISEIRSLVTIFLLLWRKPLHRTNNMQTPSPLVAAKAALTLCPVVAGTRTLAADPVGPDG